MDQQIRRVELIKMLLEERPEYHGVGIPVSSKDQQRLLRSLMNIRLPGDISDEFTKIQDEYLAEAIRDKGITDIADLTPVRDGMYLWQGDITTLKCDAIVNAANSGMTGCYAPCHGCIDNCIHTYAGVQLRNCCAEIMEKQGHEEETGKAKITPGFNLPCNREMVKYRQLTLIVLYYAFLFRGNFPDIFSDILSQDTVVYMYTVECYVKKVAQYC